MKTKIIFFDIDDTLCRQGRLPDNSRAILQRLHDETEIKLVIATGRGSVMLPHDIRALIDEGMVDGVICTNGQYNMAGGKVLSHYPLVRDDAAKLAKQCREFGLIYQQLSENHIAWSEPMERYDIMKNDFSDVCIIDPDYYANHAIYQFSVFLTEDDEHAHHEYTEAFHALGFHFTRWQEGGADLLPDGASKARGIDDVCRHFGLTVEDAMAFGDGLNDIEMLQHVGIGVAMADGWPQLKAIADHVTGTIEDDGILTALKHFDVFADTHFEK